MVEIEHGQARLCGHMAEAWQRQRAEKIAAQVRGVAWIRNEIVLDEEVRAQVIRALAEDEKTAAYLIPVKCSSGWISLGGVVPTQEVARAAGEVAALTPVVRGVLSLPWVVGLPWTAAYDLEPVRRAFQPRIGAAVFSSPEEHQTNLSGRVTQVILDPRSRLLSHLAVQFRTAQGRSPSKERLIPVTAIDAANRDSVWLKDGEVVDRYPLFHPSQYRFPPRDWRPPFPYKPGTVRWNW